MKKFFTTTFACVLGVMIAGILLTLLSIAALTGMAVSTETEYTAKPNTIMKLDLGIVTCSTRLISMMSKIYIIPLFRGYLINCLTHPILTGH